MESSKKVLLSTIGIAVVIVVLVGVTFAFFNYTRTGSSNVVKVGRIYFNTEEGNAINLSNVFPIDRADIDTNTDYVGSVTIHVTGDTTYTEGIEYLVTAVNVSNTVNNKSLPLSIDVSYEESENKAIGTNDKYYFENRGSNLSIYKVIANKTISEGHKLLVGYIAPNQTGIDGNITIKAFIDKEKIVISDTYPENTQYQIKENINSSSTNSCANYFEEINYDDYLQSGESLSAFCDGTGTLDYYDLSEWLERNWFSNEDIELLISLGIIESTTNGTTDAWVNGRSVFTTEEWNNLSSTGISFQIKVEANEGVWVDSMGNAMNTIPAVFKQNNINQNIKEIYFNRMNDSEMHQRYETATIKADLTYNDEGEVLAWLETNQTDNTKYNLIVASDGITFLTNGQIFDTANLTYANKIEFNNVNTSRVTDMHYMFSGMTLDSLDISGFDTSNVTNMSSMFSRCTINSINLTTLDLKKVNNISGMFYEANINTINMENMDLSSVTSASAAFSTSNITNLYLNGVNFSNLEGTNSMFSGSTIVNLNLSGINLSNLVYMNYMFSGATFTSINFGDEFNLPNVTDMTGTFSATEISTLDLSSWKISSLESLHSTFDCCAATIILFGDNFDTSNVTDMSYTFTGTRATTLDLSNFDTSSVTGMWGCFDGTRATTIYVSDLWNVDNVISTTQLFSNSAVVGQNGTRPYSSCTITNNEQSCSNQINTTNLEYARIDNPPDSPGYFTYKAHS